MTIFFITNDASCPLPVLFCPSDIKLSADNDTQPKEQGPKFQTLPENSNMALRITLARHQASNIVRRRTVPKSDGFLPDQSEAGRYSPRQTGTSVWIKGTAKEVSLNDLLQGAIILQILPTRILEQNSSKTPPAKKKFGTLTRLAQGSRRSCKPYPYVFNINPISPQAKPCYRAYSGGSRA